MKSLYDPHQNRIDYLGPDVEQGPLPAFFYFALSGEESLSLPPYSNPVTPLSDLPMRVFSLTIPGHGPGFDKFHAMQYWAEQMAQGSTLLENFFNEALYSIQWLIECNFIEEDKIAVGGLSRGGFVATHIAAKDTRIKTILGFASLTELAKLPEFAKLIETQPSLKEHAETLNLSHLVDNLTHVHHLLFYIGNRDTWVGTDECFHFIRKLADRAHEKKARDCNVEMRITPSVGRKGHGTHPEIFKEGSRWIKTILLGG